MKVRINRQLCASSGMCAATSFVLFDQDPDTGLGVVKVTEPPKDMEDVAREAAALCPTSAITIEEDS